MSTHRHGDLLCGVIIAVTLILTLLFMNGEKLGIQVIADEDTSSEMFTDNDLYGDWDPSGSTMITLSDEGSSVKGNGAYVENNAVHIVYAGRYVVSGSLSDGQIIIDADGDDKIWLLLSGISLRCESDAAIRVEQAGKVFVTLQEGTENTLSSGSQYGEEPLSSGVDGVIYSRDDLTLNGKGSLNVTAEYQHGIVCNDDLVFTGGEISVEAPQDGIHANDSVRLRSASLTIQAGDDGITVSNDENTSFLLVESGSVTIPECTEGMEANTVTITGGNININPTDDGINAKGDTSALITISGGEITIVIPSARDSDGLDSNGDISISGGKILISVANDGISNAIDYASEYGGTCEISGGTVLACGSGGFMSEGFAESSPQGFIMMNTSAQEETEVTLQSSDGTTLLQETVPCAFSSLIVSTPGMQVGDTCTLIVGDTETEVTVDNSSTGGGFGAFGGGFQRGGGGRGNFTGEQDGTMPSDFQNRMGRMGGGRFQMPDEAAGQDSSQSADDEATQNLPQMPDGESSQDLPQKPNDAATQDSSQMPDGTVAQDPPQMPDGAAVQDFSQMPDGAAGQSFFRRQNDNMMTRNFQQENTPAEETAPQVDSRTVLLYLGISVAVLAVGGAAAFLYKKGTW